MKEYLWKWIRTQCSQTRYSISITTNKCWSKLKLRSWLMMHY